MAESKLVLAYWGIRGLAQPVRNLLAYLKIKYEDKQYTDPQAWFGKDKASLPTDFPNLPYLLDGDKCITESEAILLHLVLKAGREDLLGSNPQEKVHLAQIKGFFGDLRKEWGAVAYNKALTKEEVVKGIQEKVVPKLKQLAQHLGKNDFIIGKLSVVDFAIGEFLNVLAHQDGDFVGQAGLKDYASRVNNLPGLKEYISSGKVPANFLAPGYGNEHIKI